MITSKTWTLTLTPDNAPRTVLTGLSETQMRRAMVAVMSGDGAAIERLTSELSAAPLQLAA